MGNAIDHKYFQPPSKQVISHLFRQIVNCKKWLYIPRAGTRAHQRYVTVLSQCRHELLSWASIELFDSGPNSKSRTQQYVLSLSDGHMSSPTVVQTTGYPSLRELSNHPPLRSPNKMKQLTTATLSSIPMIIVAECNSLFVQSSTPFRQSRHIFGML